MTSGMSAKGSALGASDPESGVPSNRAPAPRAPAGSGNGTRRGRGAKTGTDVRRAHEGQEASVPEGTSESGSAGESTLPTMSSSVRTVILGIDYDGRIVQHDRSAPLI